MKYYMIYSWNGELKWAEGLDGVYLVDPRHIQEFCSTYKNARILPVNMNFI